MKIIIIPLSIITVILTFLAIFFYQSTLTSSEELIKEIPKENQIILNGKILDKTTLSPFKLDMANKIKTQMITQKDVDAMMVEAMKDAKGGDMIINTESQQTFLESLLTQ